MACLSGCYKVVSEQYMMSGETLKERVARIEETLGEWNIEEDIVFVWADQAMNELNVQRGMMEKQD